jgi:GTP cyclohydrolase I
VEDLIHPAGVAVIVEARHLCCLMRGVSKQSGVFKSSAMRGVFVDSLDAKMEALAIMGYR